MKEVGINKDLVSNILKNNKSVKSFSISKTTGNLSSKVKALDEDWSDSAYFNHSPFAKK